MSHQHNEVAVGLRAIPLKARYEPRDEPLQTFFIPGLAVSHLYDRAVGYWSSSEVALAAKGLSHFIAGNGRMRLIVGAELSETDIATLSNGVSLDDLVAASIMQDPHLVGAKVVKSHPHEVIAWLVKERRLEIRVGVPVKNGRFLTKAESGKFFHTKIGVFSDRLGASVAFEGSNNATGTAWSDNYETFNVFESWDEAIWTKYGAPLQLQFDELWENRRDPDWHVIELPQAIKLQLISIAPEMAPLPPELLAVTDLDAREQLIALRDAPKRTKWTSAGTAPAVPLPHQAHIVKRVVETFPRGYLFADMVGMGKTIEIGLVLRELLLSETIKKVLLLVPASVLRQWQEELIDKLGLEVPRMEKGIFVDLNNQSIGTIQGTNPWSAYPIVLASSHLARRRDRRSEILEAGPWDLVIVDEAHHARRRGRQDDETPNSLLALLQQMKAKGMWKGLYLATATPMQMNPHEVWDLLELLDLSGTWAESAEKFIMYFRELQEPTGQRNWPLLCKMLKDYFADETAVRDDVLESRIKDLLGLVGSQKILRLSEQTPAKNVVAHWSARDLECADQWLRRHTPMRDRAFRNTRETLKKYQQIGLIATSVIIPIRQVQDVFIALSNEERRLYFKIDDYITRYYHAYTATTSTQALGFIMTVYRRRLTSSFAAIRTSIQRRLDALEGKKRSIDLFDMDDATDIESSLFDPEELEGNAELLEAEINELKVFVQELENMTGADTKTRRLLADVNESLREYDSVVVFTQYTDTLDFIKAQFVDAGYTQLACYSGRGGEIYEHANRSWKNVTKTEVKEKFRLGEVTVLLGTDSMSEGLNLQTCGRVFQVEMPWNFARSEQRNGRCDRIGAKYETIKVTNYFYADTVEQRVYSGVMSDFADFTEIVGAAQPVLGDIERTIERLALTNRETRDQAIENAIMQLKASIAELADRPVQTLDLGNDDIQEPPELRSEVDLCYVETVLTQNPLTKKHLKFESEDTWSISLVDSSGNIVCPGLFTFDREVNDQTEAELLVYGSISFDKFLSQSIIDC